MPDLPAADRRSSSTATLVVLALALLSFLAAGVAPGQAQDQEGDKEDRALELYEQAKKLLDEGDLLEAANRFRDSVKLNPNFGPSWVDLGVTLFQMGDIEAARDAFEEGRKYVPDSVELLYNLGLTYNKLKQYDKTIEVMQRCLELDRRNLPAIYLLALAYTRTKRYDEAIALLEEAAKRSGRDGKLYYLLGNAHYLAKHTEAAIKAYERALELDPGSVQVANNLGNLYTKLGNVEKAQEYYEKGLAEARQRLAEGRKVPQIFSLPFYNLGNAYFHMERFKEAEEAYRLALQVNPRNYRASFNLGNLLFKQKRYEDALEQYDATLRIKSDYPDVYYNLGNTHLAMGRADKALDAFRALLGQGDQWNKVHFKIGYCYFLQGDYDRALDEYSLGMKLAPDDADGQDLRTLARIYLNQQLPEDALTYANRALELDASDVEARGIVALAYFQMGYTDRAEKALKDTLRDDPNNADATFGLGLLAYAAGDFTQAAAYFRRSAEIQPNSVTLYNLAQAQAQTGDVRAALATLDRALDAPFRRIGGVRRLGTIQFSILRLKANLLARSDNCKEATEVYKDARLVEGASMPAEFFGNMALCLLRAGKENVAERVLTEAVAATPDSARLNAYLGDLYGKTGRFDEALTAFTRALDRAPTFWQARLSAANMYFRQGQFSNAAPHYARVVKQLSDEGGDEGLLDRVRLNLAHTYARLDNFAQALEQLNALKDQTVRGAAAELRAFASARLGDDLLETDDDRGALRAYRQALEGGIDTAALHTNLGVAYYRRGTLDEAKRELERALALDPTSRVALLDSAVVAYMQGRQKDAASIFERLAAADPPLAAAMRNQGIYLDQVVGDKKAALTLYQRYVDLAGSDAATVQRWIDQMKQVLGLE